MYTQPPSSAALKASADGGRRSSASGAARSVAEVERIELEWQALSCCYNTNTGKKWVLKDIYGMAHPGEMQVRAAGACACAWAPWWGGNRLS
jgi:hypothetical protein